MHALQFDGFAQRLLVLFLSLALIACQSAPARPQDSGQLQQQIRAGQLIRAGDRVRLGTEDGRQHVLRVQDLNDNFVKGSGVAVEIDTIRTCEVLGRGGKLTTKRVLVVVVSVLLIAALSFAWAWTDTRNDFGFDQNAH